MHSYCVYTAARSGPPAGDGGEPRGSCQRHIRKHKLYPSQRSLIYQTVTKRPATPRLVGGERLSELFRSYAGRPLGWINVRVGHASCPMCKRHRRRHRPATHPNPMCTSLLSPTALSFWHIAPVSPNGRKRFCRIHHCVGLVRFCSRFSSAFIHVISDAHTRSEFFFNVIERRFGIFAE